MWRASRSSVHTRRLCVCVPHEGASLWRVWGVHARGPRCGVFGVSTRGSLVVACLGCPREGASLWRIWVTTRGGLVRAGVPRWQVQVLVHGFVCTCREEMVDDFHREVTAFGGTYPGSWLSGAWQDLVTIDVRARVVSPCWVGAWSHGPELALADEDVSRASEKCLTREAAEGPAAVQQSVGRASAQIAWCRKIGSFQ